MLEKQLEFNNLHNLLLTPKSRQQLSEATGIPLNKINSWLDPDKKSIPRGGALVLMAKYFGCTVDYLLDLSDRR